MTNDPKEIQGSHATVAEGGLNPEAAFTDLNGASGRMKREAESQQEQGDGLVDSVAQQMRQSPGGVGAVARRQEYKRR